MANKVTVLFETKNWRGQSIVLGRNEHGALRLTFHQSDIAEAFFPLSGEDLEALRGAVMTLAGPGEPARYSDEEH